MTSLPPELIEKARNAKTAEELLALAKENEVEMTEESAAAYFAQIHSASGELSEDELDDVAGGGCYNNGELVVTVGTQACEQYRCVYCGADYGLTRFGSHNCWTKGLFIRASSCGSCLWCEYKDALWKCTCPSKRK